ncbi:flagellar export protein FliJ [Saccharophagus degradans]|uniref:Flagellar export protein FliJ n=1 Tax=Saccharophagus degradans TaxID=86304 RepID=A0AAW7WZU4_9GAMM|nr:flagellar export protein FliJ [Saccharophagus degradans]MBU2985844.1 flagellar export protein FliJ [Saccharophagus degradans]MDO6421005.1 flagellar export protein FliJ [Saccharophagus degradans]MDO6606084.1 flagellar export protein FliJ [Saccharophagus degradans]
MAKSDRLQVVVDMARREEDAAAEKLATIQKQLNNEIARLRDLEEYYGQYEQSQQTLRTGVNAQDLAKIRNFLQQLAMAKQAQMLQIQRVEAVQRQAREAWQTCHLKHKLMKDMIVRYKTEEQAVLDKNEQKMLDEWFNSQNNR